MNLKKIINERFEIKNANIPDDIRTKFSITKNMERAMKAIRKIMQEYDELEFKDPRYYYKNYNDLFLNSSWESIIYVTDKRLRRFLAKDYINLYTCLPYSFVEEILKHDLTCSQINELVLNSELEFDNDLEPSYATLTPNLMCYGWKSASMIADKLERQDVVSSILWALDSLNSWELNEVLEIDSNRSYYSLEHTIHDLTSCEFDPGKLYSVRRYSSERKAMRNYYCDLSNQLLPKGSDYLYTTYLFVNLTNKEMLVPNNRKGSKSFSLKTAISEEFRLPDNIKELDKIIVELNKMNPHEIAENFLTNVSDCLNLKKIVLKRRI